MDELMTKEESYANRRKLFKDIWDTTLNMSNKNGEMYTKPKVIKTLRLDEEDRLAGKRKRQKIRNLRIVCNKLLDFCDRQEAEDLRYNQVVVENKVSLESKLVDGKKRRLKISPKKHKGTKNTILPINTTAENITMDQCQTTSGAGALRSHTSPSRIKFTAQKYMDKTNAIPLRKKPKRELLLKNILFKM